MALLHESVESKKFDVRMMERSLSRGRISQDEIDKNLKKLPDDADSADWVSIDSLNNDQKDLN